MDLDFNFASSDPSKAKASVAPQKRTTGGPWKERVKQNQARRRELKKSTPVGGGGSEERRGAADKGKGKEKQNESEGHDSGGSRQTGPRQKNPEDVVERALKEANSQPSQSGRPGSFNERPSRTPVQSESTSEPGRSTPSTSKAARPSVSGPSGSSRPQFISSLFSSVSLPTAASTSGPIPILPPSNAPSDKASFTSLGLLAPLAKQLETKLNLTKGPTEVQSRVVPYLIASLEDDRPEGEKRDVFIQSQTGSGKTLAFLLPIVQDLLELVRKLEESEREKKGLGKHETFEEPDEEDEQAQDEDDGEERKGDGETPLKKRKKNPRQRPLVDRTIGTLAIILVPTRELASQIHTVLLKLLSFIPPSSSNISPTSLTPGLLLGGSTRNHEKARLRKGLPIVVGTPGRVLDHLKSSEGWRIAGEPVRQPQDRNVNRLPLGTKVPPRESLSLRWLVLDEADRMMDMGFEPQVREILQLLDSRHRTSSASLLLPTPRRRSILCSATSQGGIFEVAQEGEDGEKSEAGGVTKLVGLALRNPILIQASADKNPKKRKHDRAETDTRTSSKDEALHTPPSQLSQSYILVPTKLRFVALVSLLRRILLSGPSAGKGKGPPKKVLVFLSCTAAVDFYWAAMGGMKMGRSDQKTEEPPQGSGEKSSKDAQGAVEKQLAAGFPLLPNIPIYRLHGNLDLQARLGSLSAFSGASNDARAASDAKQKGGPVEGSPAILLCTSLAARGLDVPFVSHVVQFDPPTEGGATEYIHRVGRTARAGKSGEAWTFVLPSELDWIPWVEESMRHGEDSPGQAQAVKIREVGVKEVLKTGFGGGDEKEYETRATDVQMAFERWVTSTPNNASQARLAFMSHVRAYATHPSDEKRFFHVKNLHLGHLAKAFGLREAPSGISGAGQPQSKAKGKAQKAARDVTAKRVKMIAAKAGQSSEFHIGGAELVDGFTKDKKRKRA